MPRPGSPVPSTPERREGLRACYWVQSPGARRVCTGHHWVGASVSVPTRGSPGSPPGQVPGSGPQAGLQVPVGPGVGGEAQHVWGGLGEPEPRTRQCLGCGGRRPGLAPSGQARGGGSSPETRGPAPLTAPPSLWGRWQEGPPQRVSLTPPRGAAQPHMSHLGNVTRSGWKVETFARKGACPGLPGSTWSSRD